MRHTTWFFPAVLLVFLIPAARADDYTAPGVTITAGDPNGVRPKPLAELEVGDSLAVAVTGASPRTPVEMRLEDARGREWSYSRVTSDERGEVPETLFWYQTGVIGTTTRRGAFRPDPAFVTFDEAARFFADNTLQLTVRELDGRLLATRRVRPRPRTTAFVYPSNAEGVLENAVNANEEALYVTGRNFPEGATVQLFLVPNRFGYGVGDPFEPAGDAVRTITLERGQTGFTAELVPRMRLMKGSYDIIARAGDGAERQVQADDVISFGEETGVVAYITNVYGHWVLANSAGRLEAAPADFEYSGSFEKGEDIWVAIDPTDIPENHAGGSYAATWIIEDHSWFWYGLNPTLQDVNGPAGADIHRVKANSLGLTRKKVWAGATHDKVVKAYDVVVDFGATAANSEGQYVWDKKYDKGLDFVDGYYGPAFFVSEEPGAEGKFKVGVVDYLDENGISGVSGPFGVQLGWARIMYPATEAGTKKPVASGGPFPIVLFLHGNHAKCDIDGEGQGMGHTGILPCPPSMRVPSHLGYDYIMKRLASQGFFCISINAYDLQWWDGQSNIESRGKLVLKYLDKITGWNNNGGDPWNSLFKSKLDLTRIGLSGHSRGGEGVAAAERLNETWPTKHSIRAINAIAPTDIDSNGPWVPQVPYFLLAGARDGDVSDMHGFRTYDRMFTDPDDPWDVKTAAYVYGANHNYFNTIWTPAEDLGNGGINFWAGAKDDCKPFSVFSPQTMMSCLEKMSAPTQRQIALSTIAAFFRWQLQGLDGYREVFTGVLKPKAMKNDSVFWSFQDGTRKAVDHFEKWPFEENKNSLGGQVTDSGFTTHEQRLFNRQGSWVVDPPAAAQETAFVHDTVGLLLKYADDETYTTTIPIGHRDVSEFTHLTFRVAKKATLIPALPGLNLKLEVNIEDGAGNKGTLPADLFKNFTIVPHPFVGSEEPNLSQMVSVRIPLQYFTANGSGVDLTDVARIIIKTKGADEIGIDDIELGK